MTTQIESQSIAIQRELITDLRHECAVAKAAAADNARTVDTLVAAIAVLTRGRAAVIWDEELRAAISAHTTLAVEDNGGGGWILRTKKGTENDRS